MLSGDTERYRERQSEIQREREGDTERDTERHRERYREKEREICGNKWVKQEQNTYHLRVIEFDSFKYSDSR